MSIMQITDILLKKHGNKANQYSNEDKTRQSEC